MDLKTINKPGSMITYRDRDWIVLPSEDSDLLLIKPLGGSDEEITALYLPLGIIDGEKPSEASFPLPTKSDLGTFESAKLLFDASRLSFRNASGPFRSMGKLSFRPRSYQIVPLVMALQQPDKVRLMIADDVGIGKTIEALIILKELMERGEVKKFAVICPPHLCDQWQMELKDKLDIEAEIIRSSIVASLDRQLPDDNSIFHHFPYQVISIDYLKADKRRGIFLNDCPEFIIVDEAHTCALPQGAKSKTQQQRHNLIYDIAEKPDKHILLLTATPHSGKDGEFLSLLGLINKDFKNFDFSNLEQKYRRKIAKQFIQRKRDNIKRWLKEETPFPDRDSKEIPYMLSQEYNDFYKDVLRFARGMNKDGEKKNTARIRYWAALALLRGVMSSPATGYEMLQNRKIKKLDNEDLSDIQAQENPVIEKVSFDTDSTQSELLDIANLQREELNEIERLSNAIKNLYGGEIDWKLRKLIKLVKDWVSKGFYPIVFCKYIQTAKYIGKHLKESLPAKTDVQVITSELADEQRKEKVQLMGESPKRVLVATDCLSEGINLQEHFTAIIHYDLPWNPNRIEQRNGRIDRYGQTAKEVKTYILFGEDNPMDRIVLDVIIRKIVDIQKATGVSITIGEDNQSIMDAVMKEILVEEDRVAERGIQLNLFDDKITNEIETARQKAENLKSIFAHESIKPETIEADLKEVDEAIGDVKTVESFVINSLQHLGARIERDKYGFELFPQNLPQHLKSYLGEKLKVLISFESPTPKGYRYIGRNHQFVEHLCQFMLSLAFEANDEYDSVARVAEIQTDIVQKRTTLVMFRVRNVIKEVSSKNEVIAEEMYLWGYSGSGEQTKTLEYAEAKELLQNARSIQNISPEKQQEDLDRELHRFETLQSKFLNLAIERAENLVKAHGRFKQLVGGRRYEKATPVLPPDVMGVYILMPKPKSI
jgi:superfamily II DNA or RNA helicase